MNQLVFFALFIVLLPALVFAQEKVEGPAWNEGDKWVFTHNGTIEILRVEQNAYVVKFSDDICVIESQGFNTIIFEKSNLNRIYSLKGDKRNKYTAGRRNILNFPLTPRKQWENSFSSRPVLASLRNVGSLDYYEKFKILGWDDIAVQGGKFKALKMEVIGGHAADPPRWIPAVEAKTLYWYSPDVKYFVKCEYDPDSVKTYKGEVFNWELTSFQLKK